MQPNTSKDAPPVKCPKSTRTPANQHCHLSPRNPTHCPSRLSPWISLSNSLSRRDLTQYSRSPTTTVQRRQCSCRVTRRSTQQEWQNYTPHMYSPTMASPRKSYPIGTLALPPTSHERCAVC